MAGAECWGELRRDERTLGEKVKLRGTLLGLHSDKHLQIKP